MNKALIQRLTNVDLTKCADMEAEDGVLGGCCGCGDSEREVGTSNAAAD